ncbi:MAG: signal recognition particle receptor subunit alpha, partial [Pseudomonadota bacterium]
MGNKISLFNRLKQGLSKTRDKFSAGIKAVLRFGTRLDDETTEQLAEALIAADVGPRSAERMAGDVQTAFREGRFENPEDAVAFLKQDIKDSLKNWDTSVCWSEDGPTVWLVAGVNGVGKTTSIAKLAWWYKQQGKRIMICAGDTYRAAAVEQITIWSERIGVDIVKQQSGGDPAAVVYDAVEAAIARKVD